MGDKVPRPAPSSSRAVEDDVRWLGRGIEDDVKDLIEKCLQQYMTINEVKTALRENFGIDPRLTNLVWRKLEEDNRQFFHDYYIRLKLIGQIEQFNKLLEHQLLLQEALAKRTLPCQGEHSPMPSSCCLPFHPPGKSERGASPLRNQGPVSLPSDPASSGSPDLGEFETEADQLNSVDFLLDSPEHPDPGWLPDAPPEPKPGSQAPGKTY